MGYKSRLRHRSVHRVDQQQYRVNHGQNPLYLATEVRVSGGVDDVNLSVPVIDRGILGQNCNAALFLEIVAVHSPLGGTGIQ